MHVMKYLSPGAMLFVLIITACSDPAAPSPPKVEEDDMNVGWVDGCKHIKNNSPDEINSGDSVWVCI